VKQRSLLCSIEGFITYIVESPTEMRTPSYVWGFLKREFEQDVTDSVKGMRIFKNHFGAAFDVPEKFGEQFDKFIEEKPDVKGFAMKKAESLPEFEEEGGSRGVYANSYGYSYNNGGASQSYGSTNGDTREDKPAGRGFSKVLKSNRDDRKVFVGGVSFDTTEKDLESFFRDDKFEPEEVFILKDDQGKSRGIAFVLFDDADKAKAATRMNGKKLKGRSLRINMANEKPQPRN